MLDMLKDINNETYTENGAITYKSTGSECLDLFSTVGAMRQNSQIDICKSFIHAYDSNPDLAMKILFYARDIRQGIGERYVFRTILKYLAFAHKESVIANLAYIGDFGRYDDYLVLMDTPCEKEMLAFLKVQFLQDLKTLEQDRPVSLLGKWLPSINASSKDTVRNAKKIAEAFGLSNAEYRKSLTMLRKKIDIIENYLREKDYSFDYTKQPGLAMLKYNKAFHRHDEKRYSDYLDDVSNGTATMHTETVTPFDVVSKVIDGCRLKSLTEEEKNVLDVTWNALPSINSDENMLAVVDNSGSMYCDNAIPASVALSLGLYLSQQNHGMFHNHFITFSEHPQLLEVKGETFYDQFEYIHSYSEIANTNLEAVFYLILKAAVKNHVSQSELPSTLVIISDMEFDYCVENSDLTNFENAKKIYEKYGYTLPKIIFWNVNKRRNQQPVKQNEQGVALVSGYTPKLFNMVASGNMNPYEYMMDIMEGQRYAMIHA